MIEVKNLTMKYKNGKGVSDITISVDNGEVKGLLGPNGSGKSTLYNIIIGQHMADKGKVIINNKDISEIPIHERTKLGLGHPKLGSVLRGCFCTLG